MSELFTKTPPTEPGWYWLRDGTGEPWIARLFRESNGDWWIAEHSYGDDFPVELMPEPFMYGPRILSPEQLAEMTWVYETVLAALRSRSDVERDLVMDVIDAKLEWKEKWPRK